MPTYSDGGVIVEITQEELDAMTVSEPPTAEMQRRQRDNLLTETDWWANSDVTMTDEQRAYRQALRDITLQEGFPHNVTWPTKPE